MSVTSLQASSSDWHFDGTSSKETPHTYRLGLVGANAGRRLVKPTHSSSGITKPTCSERQPPPSGHSVLMTQLAAASL